MRSNRIHIAIFVISLLGVVMTGCTSSTEDSLPQTSSNDSLLLPTMETHGASIAIYDGRRVSTAIDAEILHRFDDLDSTMGYKLDVHFYDTLGQVTAHLVADSGVIREETGRLEAFGNIVINTNDNRTLETNYLYWTSDSDTLRADAPVKYYNQDQVMNGSGFIYDCKTGERRIFNASGTAEELGNIKEM